MKKSRLPDNDALPPRRRSLVICSLLAAAVTFLVFVTARTNEFVVLDDYGYIVDNRNIDTLSLKTITWCLTGFCEGNWHPLTMLSLALDRHFWGLAPAGYLVENAVCHACSVFTVCLLFFRLLDYAFAATRAKATDTGPGRTAMILGACAGALFWGLHPLRVESVTWASERKDVLCMLFMVLSLFMYTRYATARVVQSGSLWRSGNYLAAFGFAVLAVMSKPTAVSLPLIMTILDRYPLRRIADMRSLVRMVVEKIPFYLLAAFCAFMTLVAQHGAMKAAPTVAIGSRLLVACRALVFYLYTTAIPVNLTVFYQHPGELGGSDLSHYLGYALVTLVTSAAVWLLRRRLPGLAAFWLFYLITLGPMLGIVQVGGQWAADRYSYLPALGMGLAWAGGVTILAERLRRNKRVWTTRALLLTGALQLLVYTVLTLQQIRIWRTTETLASRIIEVSPETSSTPYLTRAIYRNKAGRYAEALADLDRGMQIALRRELPKSRSEIAFERAVILKSLGRYAEALASMEWGIAVSPTPPPDALELSNELARLQHHEEKRK